jgi:alpha-galactosidase/6-phospho-beta-glucosidase family protein
MTTPNSPPGPIKVPFNIVNEVTLIDPKLQFSRTSWAVRYIPSIASVALAYYTYVADKYKDQEILKDESYDLPPRSVEYCAYIIEALETGKTFKFSGNLRNNGMISNLPDDGRPAPMVAEVRG